MTLLHDSIRSKQALLNIIELLDIEQAMVVVTGFSKSRINSSNWWRVREMLRFVAGDYVAPTFAQEDWFVNSREYRDHFLHISSDGGQHVAYCDTSNMRKVKKDVVQCIKVGRYLAKYFSHVLTAEQIKEYVQQHRKHHDETKIHFAVTADEIEEVYANGPSSCMGKTARNFDSYCHPCRVYGDSDAQVAYIKRRGEITARTVVVRDDKIYVRLYGDSLLRELLEADGYSQGDLDGCKLNLLWEDDGDSVVMPYLDMMQEFDVMSDHILITSDGEHEASSQSGVVELERHYEYSCNDCGSGMDEEDVIYPYNGEGSGVCSVCLDNNYVEVRDQYNDWVYIHHHDGYIETYDNNRFVNAEAAESCGYCYTIDDQWLPNSEVVSTTDDEWIAKVDAVKDYNGDWIRESDAVEFIDDCGDTESILDEEVIDDADAYRYDITTCTIHENTDDEEAEVYRMPAIEQFVARMVLELCIDKDIVVFPSTDTVREKMLAFLNEYDLVTHSYIFKSVARNLLKKAHMYYKPTIVGSIDMVNWFEGIADNYMSLNDYGLTINQEEEAA